MLSATIDMTGSKSETNRLLLLQALFKNIKLKNISNSDDAKVMEDGLQITTGEVDIHHAGTAMRFLTSFFAVTEGKDVLITGSSRMKQRPIKILVEALRNLGAEIEYVENEGYPPLSIRGKKITTDTVKLPANISSQYISSLMLVAPSLEKGLTIQLLGEITSVPYIKMTLALLHQIGAQAEFNANTIRIESLSEVKDQTFVVESDWSSASYFYSLVALADMGSEIRLTAYKKDSLQGDSILADIYKVFGVETVFHDNAIILKKTSSIVTKDLNLNLTNAPDIAQTILVSCFGLGIGCHLTGLHTLPIKETDRLAAMKTELEKLGGQVDTTDESIRLYANGKPKTGIAIETYNDHRMAMAFAPLALKASLIINDAAVVSKSYPDFWQDMGKVGLKVNTLTESPKES